ncbi:MAG: peptidoglycan-associated lipoprotein Pal [Desulfuromonadales bacterium]|nr:peptidoglycan-associated lipoprotein Pal [Desulfuromonadales bacterium]
MTPFRSLSLLLLTLLLCSGLIACSSKTKPTLDDQGAATDLSSQPQVAPATDQPIGLDKRPEPQAIAGLQRIHFDFDQFVLRDDARAVLAQNADYLRANSAAKVVIEGHCDERGSDEYNLALGESRARAAKNYLISLGIDAARLSVISYGEEKPLDPRSTEQAWAQNRRAEFKESR